MEDSSPSDWRIAMNEIIRVILFSFGGILIGIASAVKLLCWVSVRNCGDSGEGCLANLIAIPMIAIALYLFYVAL